MLDNNGLSGPPCGVPSIFGLTSPCSLGRRFAADFLQIPPHGGHPCLKLTVTTAFTAQDFNLIEYVHASHTKRANHSIKVICSLHFNFDDIHFCDHTLSVVNHDQKYDH